MHGGYLPDWFYGFVPPSWWPGRPRDFFTYTLNVLPLGANLQVTRSVVFSKRVNALVFGGTALVTTTTDDVIVQPAAAVPPDKLVRLANPAGDSVFTSHPVPLESLFGVNGYGTPVGPRAYQGRQAALWPIPIAVMRGAELQVILVNLNTAAAHNVRITFYVAVIDAMARKAA